VLHEERRVEDEHAEGSQAPGEQQKAHSGCREQNRYRAGGGQAKEGNRLAIERATKDGKVLVQAPALLLASAQPLVHNLVEHAPKPNEEGSQDHDCGDHSARHEQVAGASTASQQRCQRQRHGRCDGDGLDQQTDG
jgi:hypothetical protein